MNSNREVKTKSSAEKTLDFIIKNKNPLIGSLFALVALLIGFGVMNNLKTQANQDAANAFYIIQKNYEKMVMPEAPSQDSKEPMEPKKLTEAQVDELMNQFNVFFKEHGGTGQASFSLVDMVYVLKDNGYTAKAIEFSKNHIDQVDKGSMPYAMALLQLGSLQMESEDYEAAIETLNKVETLEQAEILKGEAMIKKGLSYQALNKLDQAKEAFDQTSKLFPDSEYGQSAKKYLRVLLINN